MLFNEPKLLKNGAWSDDPVCRARVSVLFNEPKLLKNPQHNHNNDHDRGFSALQRAEIAEKEDDRDRRAVLVCFVSVLFNEPKLLKN